MFHTNIELDFFIQLLAVPSHAIKEHLNDIERLIFEIEGALFTLLEPRIHYPMIWEQSQKCCKSKSLQNLATL